MKFHAAASAISLALLAAACGKKEPAPEPQSEAAAPAETATPEEERDVFTYANYDEARVTHLDLDLTADFDVKTLSGVATLDFDRLKPDVKTLVLDTNDLDIKSVEVQAAGGDWIETDYDLGPDDPLMGSKLTIAIPDGASEVRIDYTTSPGAEGLQWLDPAQTAGKAHPYMYSQNQTIFARTMAPLQDTPAVRITYSATIHTPPDLLAVMSAEQDGGPRDGDYHFEMPQKIPSYLLALAIGDIDFEPISDKIGVYSEPTVVGEAATEFEDTPQMMTATEGLYGPYRWSRYDMLILPPSYPFGGMENPRLTFLTPTIIAGDKSLVATVAHELAHSWSGNLVTNATWRDAWLNEGVTSYVENRIIEAVYGRSRAVMEQALALEELKEAIAEAARPELTQLKMPADLENPEDAFTQVAYVKGEFFLIFLEERFGRETFDAFLKQYFDHFAFQSITTEDFLGYLKAHLMADHPGVVSDEEIHEWLYEPGLPSTAANPQSDAFTKVDAQLRAWFDGGVSADDIDTTGWSAQEWIHFVSSLPEAVTADQLGALDKAYHLTGTENAEIAFVWYMKAIEAGYEPAFPELKKFLLNVGRGRFIYRLYKALKDSGREDWAKEVYAEARPGYHPIAQRRIDEILG